MSEGIEAGGVVATGALVARAVEPRAGEAQDAVGTDGHTHESACLNCATALAGPYCHACGQAAHLHRSIGALGHDIAHGVFHFEGKFFATLPMLFFRPGELTRRYIHGERAKFVSPLALFLFSVFLMFAVVSWLGLGGGPSGYTADELPRERAKIEAQIKSLDSEIAEARRDKAPAERIEKLSEKLAEARLEQAAIARGERYVNPEAVQAFSRDTKVNTGWESFDKAATKAASDPKLLIYKLKSNGYKFSWALIPISLPFIWLLFAWKRGFRMYDHAIFATYSLSFMSLLQVIASIVGHLPVVSGAADLLFFVPPFHMYRQLRGAYSLSRASALWRTVALLFFALLAVILFLTMLLAMGIMG